VLDGLEFDAFDPRVFREAARSAIARLEHHLADSSIQGLELIEPAVLQRAARKFMTSDHERIAPFDATKLTEIIDLYVRTGIHVHSPGAMGRQFSGAVPLGALVDMVSSAFSQPSSFYEAGQLPNVAERIMAEELGRFIGWDPDRSAMVTTSGGSLANLTALLAARNDRFPLFWSDGITGLAGGVRPAIAVGDDVHYSVTRAAGILGIGDAQIVRLPLNGDRQICMARAEPTLEAARRRGLEVFCLVASAGSTAVGAFDPLDQLADLARTRDLWLHVDGAHGASLLVSDTLRHKLRGVERADSLVWDAHKLMFVPAACTLLFYRDRDKSYRAFRQDASYVFDAKPSVYTELDSAEKNLECTKRPMIMSLWVLWAIYGRRLFADKIEYVCELTEQAHRLLLETPDFETLHRPEANILCFRYRPDDLGHRSVSELQVAIRDRIRQQGAFFISKVDIDGAAALRVVMMNHRTTLEHFRALLDEVVRAGRSLMGQPLARIPRFDEDESSR
jgi:L-2,4-diaminobutyrate decarboxylase